MEDDEHDPLDYVRRGLILAILVLDVVLLWNAIKGDPEVMIAKAKVRRLWKQLRTPSEFREAERRAVGRVLWEATQVVEEADRGT